MPRARKPVMVDCNNCEGRGWVYNPRTKLRDTKCTVCNGKGSVQG